MIGLTVLLVLALYIWAGYQTIKRLQTRKAKFIAAAVYVLIPTWDIVPGYIYFYSICGIESGQRINKTVELPAEYYLIAGDIDKSRRDEWGKYPIAKGGELNRLKLKERYIHTNQHDKNYFKLFHITKVYSFIQDKQTSQILGDATSFVYSGGWLENSIFEFPGNRWCPDTLIDNGFIHSTLEEKIFKAVKSPTEPAVFLRRTGMGKGVESLSLAAAQPGHPRLR